MSKLKQGKYNNQFVTKGGKRPEEQIRQKFAKHRDIPTIASATPGLDIPEALKQIDPKMLSQLLPNMYNNFGQVRNLLNSFNSMKKRGGSGGSGVSSPKNSQYLKKSITDVFSGALALSVKNFNYYTVLNVLFKTLADGNYKNITEEYKDIVFNALIDLIQKAEEYGDDNIPFSILPPVVYGTNVPTPLHSSYEAVPDYYIQQYYLEQYDPYPGYIQWLGENGDYIYIKRKTTDYPFETAEKEVFTLAEYAFAKELFPYIKNNTLTVTILNTLLQKYCVQIDDNVLDKNMGKNSKNNLSSLLSLLSGLAGQLADKTKSNHLPNSVLDIASVTKTLNYHKESIGKAKKIKQLTTAAVLPRDVSSLLSSLSGLSGVPGLSSLGNLSSLGGLNGISNLTNLVSIFNQPSNKVSSVQANVTQVTNVVNNIKSSIGI